jgi:hypothetical protein
LILVSGVFGLALGLLPAAPATAQSAFTITINANQIDHSLNLEGRKPTEIWYAECVDSNATIEIPFTVSGSKGDADLEAWVGSTHDCSNDATRDDRLNEDCFNLGRIDSDRVVTLRVRDLLGPVIPDGADANNPCAIVENTDVTLYLLLMEGATAKASARQTFDVDFEGPDAPELNKVGVGEQQLYADWDGSSSTDIDGYHVFCELIDPSAPSPAGGSAGSTSSGGADTNGAAGDTSFAGIAANISSGGNAGDASSGGTAGDVSAGGTAGTVSSGGTAGTVSSGGTAGETSTGGTSGNVSTGGTAGDASTDEPVAGSSTTGGSTNTRADGCNPALLIPGQRPAAGLLRSQKHSRTATSGASARLENGRLYACAVAGVDSQGNLGTLSDFECGTPEDLTDFYEAYTRAGGRGGGGFCAFGPPRRGSAFAVAGLGVAALIARRRYRSKRR